MIFPRPWKGHKEFELQKPDTETILKLGDRAQSGKRYSSLLALLEGSVASIDGDEPKDLREMPLVDAEYVAREAFRLYDIPTLVEGVYGCERCGHKNIHEETAHGDSRDDVADLDVTFCTHEDLYELELEPGNEVKIIVQENSKSKTIAELNKYTFRDPTMADMLRIESDSSLKDTSRRVNKLYFMCIVDLDGIVSDGSNVLDLKNRYMFDLLNFPSFNDWMRIAPLLHTYGMNPFIDVTCEKCGKEFSDPIDFTGFFVSALLSQSRKRAAR